MIVPSAAFDDRAPGYVSARRRSLQTFLRNRTSVIGVALVVALILIAVFAPWIAPHDPYDQSVRNRLELPSREYLMGRDDKGRDIFSRVIFGTRIALQVGIFSVLLGGTLGTAIGVAAAYFGGKVDATLMRLTDVLLAFPDLITGLLVLAVLGPGLNKMILAIGLTIAPRFSRIAYGPTLSLKNRDFVDAARTIGVGNARILRVHLLPNILGELLVFGSLWTASAWGQMIREGTLYLTTNPWYSLGPGLALLITVLAFNLVGDGLRDALDPRSR
jgi:peptide/nickel transport system permease protein